MVLTPSLHQNLMRIYEISSSPVQHQPRRKHNRWFPISAWAEDHLAIIVVWPGLLRNNPAPFRNQSPLLSSYITPSVIAVIFTGVPEGQKEQQQQSESGNVQGGCLDGPGAQQGCMRGPNVCACFTTYVGFSVCPHVYACFPQLRVPA